MPQEQDQNGADDREDHTARLQRAVVVVPAEERPGKKASGERADDAEQQRAPEPECVGTLYQQAGQVAGYQTRR